MCSKWPSASGPLAFSGQAQAQSLTHKREAVNLSLASGPRGSKGFRVCRRSGSAKNGHRNGAGTCRQMVGRSGNGREGTARRLPRLCARTSPRTARERAGKQRALASAHAPASRQGCCGSSACHCPRSLQTWAQRKQGHFGRSALLLETSSSWTKVRDRTSRSNYIRNGRGNRAARTGAREVAQLQYGMYAAHPWTKPRDRTLEELDTAIAATEATAKKVDNLVQDKESRAKSAETRTKKLVAVLNSVCDDCATIPCLLPAVGESSAACIVCGSSIDRVVREIFRAENFPGGYLPAKKKPSQSELARELASHIGDVSHRIFSSPRKSEFRVIDWRTANLQQGTPTRHQMLSQAEALVKAAKAELAQARQLKTQCDQQKQTLKQEQQQLVARLGGLLGGAKGAKRKASDESCSVCLTATKTHVLIPCGHKCVCDQCARGYRAGSHCPICRGRVQSVVRVFD